DAADAADDVEPEVVVVVLLLPLNLSMPS
ncbi:hypothetical protein A2U01_0115646, partial [Trifolium medium]|nr:hypothetical protein [Trifolium medium]